MWTCDSGNVPIKATPLMVDGLLYFSVPDKAWAADARTGRIIWHWETKTRGGIHIGHRGMAMYGKWLFLVTPDDYLVSLDAATGKQRWRIEIADLKLDYFSTVAPVVIRANSIVALNSDNGKMAWYYQTTPHDTHDWDSAETPVLFDSEIDKHPRKLIAQANRNGYFFVLDRTNGRHILTTPFASNNWAKGLDDQGRPIRDLSKDPQPAGVLVIPSESGATNWFPPSLDPKTGFFYVRVTR
jgi:glucose dehydrogenase